MSTTELATAPKRNGALARMDINNSSMDLRTFGEVCARSGFFKDSRDAAQAIVKIQAGAELGFPAIASMTGIYIVEGKVTVSANLMAAAVKKFAGGKYNYRVEQLDDTGCWLEFYEGGKPVGKSSFTEQDMSHAGLANRDNWKKYRRNMYFARAMSNGAKWYCPDVFGGPVYTPDELGAEIDGETGELKSPKSPLVNRTPAPAADYDDPNFDDFDDFLAVWDNVAEGKGLDHPTSMALLKGWARRERQMPPEELGPTERGWLLDKLRGQSPESIERIKHRAAEKAKLSPVGGSAGVAAPTGPGDPSTSAPASEPSEVDTSGAEAEPLADVHADELAAFQNWYVTAEELWTEGGGDPKDFKRRMGQVFVKHRVKGSEYRLTPEQRAGIVKAIGEKAGHFA